MDNWHLYLIRTRHQTLYTGITTDIARRMSEHGSKDGKGAKYLRSRGPLELVYQAEIGARPLALKAEHALKKLSKAKKEEIILENPESRILLKILRLSLSSEGA